MRLKGVPEQEEIARFMQHVPDLSVDTEFSDDDEDTKEARVQRNKMFLEELQNAQDEADQSLWEMERKRKQKDREARRELGEAVSESTESDDSASESEEMSDADMFDEEDLEPEAKRRKSSYAQF
ncbi:hypothetical protein MMC11_006113 [Xylographa trunciseda]|nr:hypothetical protein [Xylographa trunciseda]